MAECWVRLGFAVAAIALITAAFYYFGNRPAVAVEPTAVFASIR